ASTIIGTGVAAGASGALTGARNLVDNIPQLTRGVSDRLRNFRLQRLFNRAEQTPEVGFISSAARSEDNLIRQLNTNVQEQRLNSELNRLPREVREAASDVPAYQRPPVTDDLDA